MAEEARYSSARARTVAAACTPLGEASTGTRSPSPARAAITASFPREGRLSTRTKSYLPSRAPRAPRRSTSPRGFWASSISASAREMSAGTRW